MRAPSPLLSLALFLGVNPTAGLEGGCLLSCLHSYVVSLRRMYSVMGEKDSYGAKAKRGQRALKHREFIVYDDDQIYPEYHIWFNRSTDPPM